MSVARACGQIRFSRAPILAGKISRKKALCVCASWTLNSHLGAHVNWDNQQQVVKVAITVMPRQFVTTLKLFVVASFAYFVFDSRTISQLNQRWEHAKEVLKPTTTDNNVSSALLLLSGRDDHEDDAGTATQVSDVNEDRSSVDIFQDMLNRNEKIVLVELGKFTKYLGFGAVSKTIAIFQHYAATRMNRTMIVDESRFAQYRVNQTHGLYGGSFRTKFPVLESVQDKPTVLQSARNASSSTLGPLEKLWIPSIQASDPTLILTIPMHAQPQWKNFFQIRRILLRYYTTTEYSNNTIMFQAMMPFFCQIQTNPETKARVDDILQQASIPSFHHKENDNSVEKQVTVAFHIRRGDKIKRESRAFEASEYVSTLIAQVPSDVLTKIRQCYVATDEYTVVAELEQELRKASIHCTLYTLARPQYDNNRNAAHAALFFADLQMLQSATYFIGSLNSNVGQVTALWRACRQQQEPGGAGASLHNQYNHFAHTYGVDRDEWSMW